LCTIDRNLGGALGAFILHGICETHVSHHVCSKIPHYNAWEATEALKSVLGDHYMKSDDNMYYSLVNNYKECKFVEDEGSCLFYRNKYGKSVRKVVNEEDSGVDGLQTSKDVSSGSDYEEEEY
jgi:omega-6 fatty acid desaturase (delta-12 desaturase)